MPDMRIIVEVDEVQLFGNEYPPETGYDAEASGQQFCDMLRQQIRNRYPTAELRVEYTSFGGVGSHITSWDHGVDECQLAEMVIDEIMDEVYQGRWEVAA